LRCLDLQATAQRRRRKEEASCIETVANKLDGLAAQLEDKKPVERDALDKALTDAYRADAMVSWLYLEEETLAPVFERPREHFESARRYRLRRVVPASSGRLSRRPRASGPCSSAHKNRSERTTNRQNQNRRSPIPETARRAGVLTHGRTERGDVERVKQATLRQAAPGLALFLARDYFSRRLRSARRSSRREALTMG